MSNLSKTDGDSYKKAAFYFFKTALDEVKSGLDINVIHIHGFVYTPTYTWEYILECTYIFIFDF